MNLATNAIQAMPEGGSLSVSLEVPERAEGPAVVVLDVSDSGMGIEEGVLERIFDPFFTTKALNEGTGLGLSVVYGIVTSAGGRVEVTSSPGAGSRFRVHLPLVVAEDGTPAAHGWARQDEALHVLIVDDNPGSRETLRRMCAGLGHQATAMSDPEQALELFQSASEPFDVVLLDYDMPRMNGGELSQRFRDLRPGVRIVCTSGSPVPVAAREAVDALLPKPAKLSELDRALSLSAAS